MKTVITNQGISSILEASNSGPLVKVTKVRIGSSIITPTSDMTDVSSFVWEGDSSYIQYLVVDENTCLFNIILDESIGNFDVGNIGLFLEDGTMFTITSLLQVEPKYANSSGQIGNRRNYEVNLTLNNVSSLIDITMLSYYYSNLPTVLNEASLPQLNEASFNCYIVKYHTGLKSACLAIIYNDEWRFIPISSKERLNNFEMSDFDSLAIVGKPVYFDISSSKFKLAGSNGYIGFRDSNNNIINNGLFTSNLLNLTAGSDYYIDLTTDGDLTTTPNNLYVGKAVNSNTLLLSSINNSKEYVDTTSAQNISNNKTIISDESTTGAGVKFQNTAFISSDATQGDMLLDIQVIDKNNLLRCFLTSGQHTNDIINFGLALNKTDGSTLATYLTLNYNKSNDDCYVACTTPALSAAGDEIITASWFNQKNIYPKLNLSAAVAKPGTTWRVAANEYGIVTVHLMAPNYGSSIDASISSNTSRGKMFAACSSEGSGAGMIIVKPNDYIVFSAASGGYCNQCQFIPFYR